MNFLISSQSSRISLLVCRKDYRLYLYSICTESETSRFECIPHSTMAPPSYNLFRPLGNCQRLYKSIEKRMRTSFQRFNFKFKHCCQMYQSVTIFQKFSIYQTKASIMLQVQKCKVPTVYKVLKLLFLCCCKFGLAKQKAEQ